MINRKKTMQFIGRQATDCVGKNGFTLYCAIFRCQSLVLVFTCTMVDTGWILFMFFIRLSVMSATLRPMAQLV